MARTQKAPRVLAAAAATETAPAALLTAADDRLEKARLARIASIPLEERQVMEQIATLSASIEAEKDATNRERLAERRAVLEKQRKGMAFVRKFADAMIETENLAKRITALAGPSYFATPAQRGKAKAVLMAELVPALNAFDHIKETGAPAQSNAERKAAARAAAMVRLA